MQATQGTAEIKTFTVPNIGCSGCVHTVETEVSKIKGVQSVQADEETKVVIVEWNQPASWSAIKQILTDIDYPPQE